MLARVTTVRRPAWAHLAEEVSTFTHCFHLLACTTSQPAHACPAPIESSRRSPRLAAPFPHAFMNNLTLPVLMFTPPPAGEYPEAFVEEFKTFTAELRDFFNAGSLTGGWAGWARFVS